MRWFHTLLILLVAVGCRNQATPITNPFLSPDRVPPPATGVLQPGAAQPYYPGDAVPGTTNVVPPSGNYPPPATTYPPGTSPTPQSTPVTPPGGWNQPAPAGSVTPYSVQPTSGYTPATISPVEGQVVRIEPDNENLRFASVPNNNSSDIIQVAAEQQSLSQQGYVYEPPIARQGFSQPQNSFSASTSAPTLPGTASDGFRPQGSGRLNGNTSASTTDVQASAFQSQEDSRFFGYDAGYTWLRGQLQFYPETGVWGLRYITIGGGLDQYGGVAVISNPEVLGGLQPGEYLLVQGFMEVLDAGSGQFMPSYTIEGVQRQR